MNDLEKRIVMFYKETDKQEGPSNHHKTKPGSAFDDFEELDVGNEKQKSVKQNTDLTRHLCDMCVVNSPGRKGVHLCYVCNLYMCEFCFAKHDKNHLLVKLKSERKKRVKKAEILLSEMRDRQTDENLDEVDTYIRDRININTRLDNEACWITGMCGLDNARIVVIDNRNYCIKIFNTIYHTLLRYIRFGSAPRGVTRIRTERIVTKKDFEVDDKPLPPGSGNDDIRKQCASTFAVTFPNIKQIWFLVINTTEILKTKTIAMDKECYEIEFNENKLFTLCAEEIRPRCYSVDILSIEGIKLKTIYTTSHPHMYDLAVSRGKVFLTDWNYSKVYCINADNGEKQADIKIEGSEPTGITTDPSSNIVYVSAWEHDVIYELDPELKGHNPLILKDQYFKDPSRLCFHRNKLFISHRWPSDLSNLITVIQLA